MGVAHVACHGVCELCGVEGTLVGSRCGGFPCDGYLSVVRLRLKVCNGCRDVETHMDGL